MEEPKPKVKSFDIPQRLIAGGWERVRANGGAPGVDAASIAEFEADEDNNLYKLWNRMSAGSYFPKPVRAVDIPKDHGAGVRRLGVPTVADRIAQTAAAMLLTGTCSHSPQADLWEPYDGRLSRTVLREPGGAIPPGYST